MKLNYIIVPTLLLLLTLVFFHRIVLNPDEMVFPAPDTVNMLSSWRYLFSDAVHKYGNLPMWNNYETSGTPFLANILSAMFYPLNFLFLVFPTDVVFGIKLIIDIFIAGISIYLLARHLKLDKYSSFFSSIVFMFGGVFIGRINIGHEPAIDVIALVPLLFLLFLKTLENRSIKYGTFTGIVLGLQILAGYLQFAIYSAYLLGAYFVYDLIVSKEFKRKDLFKRFSLIGVVFFTGFLVSAFQFLPSLEFSKYSIQAGQPIDYELLTSDSSSYSVTPEYTISLLMPDFFGSRTDNTYWASDQFEESSAYFGILPLLLIPLALLFRRNRYVIFFAIVAAAALLFSYGQYTPLFKYLHKIILFLDIVRNPARFLFLFALSASLLAGFGLNYLSDLLKSGNRKYINRIVKVLLIFALLTYIVSIAFYLTRDTAIGFAETSLNNIIKGKLDSSSDRIGNYVLDYYSDNAHSIATKVYNYINLDINKILFVLLASAIALLSAIKFRIKPNYITLVLVLIVLFDLWIFGMKYIDVAPVNKVFPQNEIINFLVGEYENDQFRVLGINKTMEPRFATRNGIETLDGILPPNLKSYAEYITAIDGRTFTGDLSQPIVRTIVYPQMLDLLNVKYVLTSEKLDGSKPFTLLFSKDVVNLDIRKTLYYNQTVYVYQNDNHLPRVFVVNDFKVIPNRNEILNEIQKERFDPRNVVILEKNPEVTISGNDWNGISEAEIGYYSPNEITLSANMSEPGLIVLSEVWYPDWKAYVWKCNDEACSGRTEVEILRADYLFRSIYLDRGRYKIDIAYSNLNDMFQNLK